jgi:glycosyltransferase involved in cell wall biosynthesis
LKSIALLIPCLLTGGTEVATLETARAFAALGYQPVVIVYFDEIDPTMLATFALAGVRVVLLGVQREARAATFKLAGSLTAALWHGRYSLVWVQYMTPTLAPLLVARLFCHRLVAVVHVAASHYSPGALGRMRWLARSWCARFICVSHTVAVGIFGTEEVRSQRFPRVVVIPNALDTGEVRSAQSRDWRAELGWSADTVVIGFAGRLTYIKGVDLLLDAIAQLHRRGQPVRLVLVGGGDERTRLEEMMDEFDIRPITHFSGRVTRAEIFSAIKGFDIAAMPSRGGLEGFGLSALEAMAAGVPVVASQVDALAEVVIDGKTGLLFTPEDPASLADALTRLASDVVLRRQLGAAGAAHAVALYDRPAYRAGVADLLAGIGLRPGDAL